MSANTESYIDFIGEKLSIGDTVVYLRNYRTGSSTVRPCKFVGVITDFAKTKVCIDERTIYDHFIDPTNANSFGIVKIHPCDIICILDHEKINLRNT